MLFECWQIVTLSMSSGDSEEGRDTLSERRDKVSEGRDELSEGMAAVPVVVAGRAVREGRDVLS